MNLEKHMRLPAIMLCVSIAICILLMILPVNQIVSVYKNVNGIKTVEFLPKLLGTAVILAMTVLVAIIWSLVRKALDQIVAKNGTLTSYRVIRFFVNAAFFIWASLPSYMGILSIILSFNGD